MSKIENRMKQLDEKGVGTKSFPAHERIEQLKANIASALQQKEAAEAHVESIKAAIAERARLYLDDPNGSQAQALEKAQADYATAQEALNETVSRLEQDQTLLATALQLEAEEKAKEDERIAQARRAELLKRFNELALKVDFHKFVMTEVLPLAEQAKELQHQCVERVLGFALANAEISSELWNIRYELGLDTDKLPQVPGGLTAIALALEIIKPTLNEDKRKDDMGLRMNRAAGLFSAEGTLAYLRSH